VTGSDISSNSKRQCQKWQVSQHSDRTEKLATIYRRKQLTSNNHCPQQLTSSNRSSNSNWWVKSCNNQLAATKKATATVREKSATSTGGDKKATATSHDVSSKHQLRWQKQQH